MTRLTLDEREVSFTQSAADRRDGIWHVWSNDPYWLRRLERVGAVVVKQYHDGADFTVTQRQLLVRKVPAPRTGPRVVDFLQRKKDKVNRTAVEIRAGVDRGAGE